MCDQTFHVCASARRRIPGIEGRGFGAIQYVLPPLVGIHKAGPIWGENGRFLFPSARAPSLCKSVVTIFRNKSAQAQRKPIQNTYVLLERVLAGLLASFQSRFFVGHVIVGFSSSSAAAAVIILILKMCVVRVKRVTIVSLVVVVLRDSSTFSILNGD